MNFSSYNVVPHWAYHGSSRGTWDFDITGKTGASTSTDPARAGKQISAECLGLTEGWPCVIGKGVYSHHN